MDEIKLGIKLPESALGLRGLTIPPEAYRVKDYLQQTLQGLSAEFENMYVKCQRAVGPNRNLPAEDPLHLVWFDMESEQEEIPSDLAKRAIEEAGLVPASEMVGELLHANYSGYPNPDGEFAENCFALALPKGVAGGPVQKIWLVVGNFK